jgi:hypothetical protein
MRHRRLAVFLILFAAIPFVITLTAANPGVTLIGVGSFRAPRSTWGPDLSDGRHVLYVFSDNDLFPGRPTQIYAFAIDGSASGANLDFRRQHILIPTFPLWLWKQDLPPVIRICIDSGRPGYTRAVLSPGVCT